MDKPISVGDLVVVAQPTLCCGNTDSVGKIFKVAKVTAPATPRCFYCQQNHGELLVALGGFVSGHRLSRLRRIPPLDELEGQKQDEDLREPA